MIPEIADGETVPLNVALECWENIRRFLAPRQHKAVLDLINGVDTDEEDHFRRVAYNQHKVITTMPQRRGQKGKGDDAIVYLHYFGMGDWWITELDGDPKIIVDHAFGLAFIYEPEMGDICLPEILAVKGSFGLTNDMDFFWEPKTVREIKQSRGWPVYDS